jgi:hypothetical protein
MTIKHTTMTTRALLLFVLLLPLPAFTQSLSVGFGFSLDGTSYEQGHAIAVDASGNTYVTGWFDGTADFDPGPGTATLTAAGMNDIYVAKYSSTGQYLWAFQVGSPNDDDAIAISADNSGSIYVSGTLGGTADFDPSGAVASLSPGFVSDVFLAKYDSAGQYQWAFSTRANSSYSVCRGMVLDALGNLDVLGEFSGTVDVDPSTAIANLTSYNSGTDLFVVKYNSSGGFISGFRIGGPGGERGTAIASDPGGNIIFTGYFQQTMDADPTVGSCPLTANGSNDIFVSKMSPVGAFLWAFRLDDAALALGYSLATDMQSNIFLAGSFSGTLDLDGSTMSSFVTASGSNDIFLAKYNAIGSLVWGFSVGSGSGTFDGAAAVATDAMGNAYITGNFEGTADFNPGTAVNTASSNGGTDLFLARYSAGGAYQWVFGVGSASYENGGLALAVKGTDVYATGSFVGSEDFDPSAGSAILNSTTFEDIFVVKYLQTGTGVEEWNEHAALTCYPNPAAGQLTLEWKDAEAWGPGMAVEITDALGQLVYGSAMDGMMMRLDLSGFLPGLYFVQVSGPGGDFTVTKKLVVAPH